jgi:hypothetical protein
VTVAVTFARLEMVHCAVADVPPAHPDHEYVSASPFGSDPWAVNVAEHGGWHDWPSPLMLTVGG